MNLWLAHAPPAPGRDYETQAPRSEAVVHIAMTDLMARSLTDENTISWRDPKKVANSPSHDETLEEDDL